MSSGAFATCGSCLVGVAFSGCSSTIAVTCFIVGIGFNGGALVGHVVAYSDMSPNYSSILMGMGNGVGVVSGIIATYVVGALTEAGSWTDYCGLADGVSDRRRDARLSVFAFCDFRNR